MLTATETWRGKEVSGWKFHGSLTAIDRPGAKESVTCCENGCDKTGPRWSFWESTGEGEKRYRCYDCMLKATQEAEERKRA